MESRPAFERLRDVEAIGAVDLSERAVNVVRQFIAELDNPDRSDTDGVYYEEDAWTKQYLRDFQEARLVALGEMWPTTWWARRRLRAVRKQVDLWFYRWESKRASRRIMREIEERKRRRAQAQAQEGASGGTTDNPRTPAGVWQPKPNPPTS